jgi:glycosyltransferase involved in cell wall biosynthesis
MLEEVTPLILTFNEAPNIDRTLEKLTWAKTIVAIDSYSTDETLEIFQSHPQVQIFQRSFDTFAAQCNYGLEQIKSQWVLSLDADYILSDELIDEIKALREEAQVNSYFVRFKYCVFGKPLRGTLYPPRKVLYRREKAVYKEDGHAHRVYVDGETGVLYSYIYHDDRKSLDTWLKAQSKYMIVESKKLLETPASKLSISDRIRQQKILAPFIILLYCLVFKGGILDGWAGWYYAFQRMLAEVLLSIRLIENDRQHKCDIKSDR